VVLETVPEDIKLVIILDAGSNQYEEHKVLHDRGVDVLVIDHHETDEESSHACVINNQMCDYPSKSLSGVGMVYKFCSYIDTLLETNHAEQFIDLVALGGIADMMDMKDFELKHLVEKGLQNLRNPYFKTMVEKNAYSIGSELTPFGVAFYVAPYVNATIRVGTQDEKLILFESMLDYRGYELIPSTKRGCKGQVETRVEQACRNCTNIKKRQTNARDTSLNVIEHLIKERNLLSHKLLIIQVENVDKNLSSKYIGDVNKIQKVLLEDQCATKDHNGKDQKAQDLYDLLEETKEKMGDDPDQGEDGDDSDDGDDSGDDEKDVIDDEQDKIKNIQDIKRKSTDARNPSKDTDYNPNSYKDAVW
jgi:single-stranded-DNA-specific exonuclease